MELRNIVRGTRQWVPFAGRTIAYGTVSIVLGPLTRDRFASLWAMQNWCRSSARALQIKIEVTGLGNVPSAPFVYSSNHESLLDILVLGAALPGDFKWAAKRSLMNIPFLGWHLRIAGHVPVDRHGGARGASETIARFEAVLRAGKPLLVFPEGTRSRDGRLKPFKVGGFQAAVRAGVPVVPVAVEGTHRLMKRGAIDTDAGIVRVRIGPPVFPRGGGPVASVAEELSEETRRAILALLGRSESPEAILGGEARRDVGADLPSPPG